MTTKYFLLDDTLPQEVVVTEITPEGNATRLFCVVADYGWAEKILCEHCYQKDANDIAYAIGKLLNIPVKEHNA